MSDIRSGNFTFKDNGEFMLSNMAGSTLPVDMMVLFRYMLEQKFGNSGKDLYTIGKRLGKNINSKLPSDNKKALEALGVLGSGTFEFVRFDKQDRIIIKNENNTLANSAKKLFGLQKELKDELLAGILAGLFEERLKESMDGKETQCICQGKPACIFEISPSRSSSNSP